MQSISVAEKPVSHIPEPDWKGNVWNLRSTSETKRKNFSDVKNENRQMRNDAFITCTWVNYHNNKRLADRITTSQRCLEEMHGAIAYMEMQLSKLTDEKLEAEKCIQRLVDCLGIMSQVLCIRDKRFDLNLVYDSVHQELHTEVALLDNNKKYLTDKCHNAYDQMTQLAAMIAKLKLDASEKIESLDVDSAVLALDKNTLSTTHKPDVLRVPNCALTFETWLEQAKFNISVADQESQASQKLRESMILGRDKAELDFLAQFEAVNFEFRKKIFETDKQRNELEYQKRKMLDTMSVNQDELDRLRYCHKDTVNGLKCAETRVERRNQRPCKEQTRDEVQLGLFEEVMTLRDISRDLNQSTSNCMHTENQMEELVVKLDWHIDHKKSALELEKKAMDLHKSVLHTYPISQVDRNIKLYNMEREIPAETVHDTQLD